MKLLNLDAVALAFTTIAVLALALAVFSFAAMIVRWKDPRRRGHLIRLLLSFAVRTA